MWEMLCVLHEAQHRERDQDIAQVLCQVHDCMLADFTNNLSDGAAIYKRTTQEVTKHSKQRWTRCWWVWGV